MDAHIVKSYDDEIDVLNRQISAMGACCDRQLSKALESLETRDAGLAGQVIKEDENLNDLYRRVEENGVRLLAKRTPLAVDLRYLLATMRTGSELERIGDYAANIAQRVIELENCDPVVKPPVDLIQAMGGICRKMINDAVQSFLDRDLAFAIEIWHRDDQVDRKFARLMTDLRARMQTDSCLVDACTCLIFMGRCLERIGDHITNIAEDTYYIQTGKTYIGSLKK
ncbi:MAG: phosphate signaling complex protein PhoU [Desulfobacter sp.]|nr:phosphate signaling complex protein PhoU [Desulfobacter sp.]WDP85819.1 MAG: phosphate signaling complex protein PhoU [Desulfobacter sp.]